MGNLTSLRRRDIQIDGIWDIEGERWDTFVMGGILEASGRYSDYTWERERDFVDHLHSMQGTIWAHFGGGYDFKWYLDRVGPMGIRGQITKAGSRIVSVDFGHLLLCDSWALSPMKLKDFTEGLGITKEELGLECECGDNCGGYCSIKQFMEKEKLDRAKEYMRADNFSLREALYRLRDFASENDLDLGQTIGSSAWRNVQRATGLGSASPDKGGMNAARYKFARKGYYGGRTQLYRHNVRLMKSGEVRERPVRHGNELDKNSMYPWALKTFAVPIGKCDRVLGRKARAALASGKPGIYRCYVRVPDMFLPPLPARYNDGTATAYPTGDFTGTWPLPEIEWAIERGCDVRVLEAMTWSREEKLFTEWIEKLWELRAAAQRAGNVPMATWLKLYMNSLTGKFGSNPDKEEFLLNPEAVRHCQCLCGACDKIVRKCKCSRAAFRPPEICPCNPMLQRTDHVWSTPLYKIEDCAHVQMCSYLTSYSRVDLNRHQLMDGHDGETIVMSDTDSLHPEGDELLNAMIALGLVGPHLGMYKHEGPWSDFLGIAPKVYSYTCACGLDTCKRRPKKNPGPCESVYIAKAKGVALLKNPEIAGMKLPPKVGIEYKKEGIVGFSAGLASGQFFKRGETTRRLSPRLGDRVLCADKYHTRPPDARELDLDDGYHPPGESYSTTSRKLVLA